MKQLNVNFCHVKNKNMIRPDIIITIFKIIILMIMIIKMMI